MARPMVSTARLQRDGVDPKVSVRCQRTDVGSRPPILSMIGTGHDEALDGGQEGAGGILEGGDWGKPKGMHWRTYERLCREHDALSDRALVGIMDHLNHLSGRF